MMIGEGHGPVAHPLDPPLTCIVSQRYVSCACSSIVRCRSPSFTRVAACSSPVDRASLANKSLRNCWDLALISTASMCWWGQIRHSQLSNGFSKCCKHRRSVCIMYTFHLTWVWELGFEQVGNEIPWNSTEKLEMFSFIHELDELTTWLVKNKTRLAWTDFCECVAEINSV